MQCDALCPPNLDTLSEDVIGNVSQRQFFTAGFITSGVKFGCQFVCDEDPSKPNTQHEGGSNVAFPKPTKVSCRERQKIYKQRYRAKQQNVHDDLENGNRQLREDIKQLQSRLRSPPTNTRRPSTMRSVVTEYFRVFQRGLHTQKGTPKAQLDFLRMTLAPDVVVDAGTVRGSAALAIKWIALTLFFQDIDVQLKRVEQLAEDSLVATTTTRITLSRHALINVFPHLFNADSSHRTANRGLRIAEKLLGQQLVLRGSVRFDWDSSSNRVGRLYSQHDMLSPVLQLLGNVEDASFVFSGALVAPDFNLDADACPALETTILKTMETWLRTPEK